MTMLLMQLSAMAQSTTDVTKYLNEFKAFIDTIQNVQNPTDLQYDNWRAEYGDFRDQYKEKYKSVMTNEQVETYFSYCAQYNKRMGRRNLKEAGDVIDSTAVKVTKGVKRGASKVSGFVKGLFKKDKEK